MLNQRFPQRAAGDDHAFAKSFAGFLRRANGEQQMFPRRFRFGFDIRIDADILRHVVQAGAQRNFTVRINGTGETR